MSDRRGLLALDAPAIDKSRLQGRVGAAQPVPEAGFLDTIGASFRLAQADQVGDDEQAITTAYGPLVTELHDRGNPVSRYVSVSQSAGRPVNEDAVWRDIAAARAIDPKAFEGVAANRDAFRKAAMAQYRERIARDADTAARGGTIANLIGGLGAGFTDPINLGTMAIGGGGTTLARRVATEALANAGVEALQQPLVAAQRDRTGRSLTAGEAATNVALAAGVGGLFGGAIHVGDKAIDALAARRRSPAGDLADRMRDSIGVDRMTDQERAATAALDREDEILATSPYQPGAGSAAHLARVERDVRALAQGQPLNPRAETPRNRIPPQTQFTVAGYETKLATAESGGDWQIASKSSTAYGRYQFTRGTWLHYARQFPAYKGESDEALWALRTNPALQQNAFRALVADQRATLARNGIPETNGNMYMLHFAGDGAGTRILKAAEDTPIETLVSAKAIEANPFLKGKTAGEVRDWAHAKMGDPREHGPVLSREGFADDAAGDAEWRAAQAEADAAQRALADMDAEDARAQALAGIDDDIPFALDDPRGRVADGVERDPFAGLPDDMVDAVPARVDGEETFTPIAAAEPPAPDTPVIGRLPDRGVAPAFLGNDDRIHVGEVGAQHFSAISPELRAVGVKASGFVDPEGRFLNRSEALVYVNANGETIRPSPNMEGELDALDYREQSAFVPPESYGGARQRWEAANPWWTGERRFAAPAEPADALRPTDRAEVRAIEAEAGDASVAPRVEGFDHPDDVAATRQIDSLEHDLRMFLMEDEAAGLTVRLNEEGDVVSAIDAMEDVDADWAALDRAEACMAPPRGGEA